MPAVSLLLNNHTIEFLTLYFAATSSGVSWSPYVVMFMSTVVGSETHVYIHDLANPGTQQARVEKEIWPTEDLGTRLKPVDLH